MVSIDFNVLAGKKFYAILDKLQYNIYNQTRFSY